MYSEFSEGQYLLRSLKAGYISYHMLSKYGKAIIKDSKSPAFNCQLYVHELYSILSQNGPKTGLGQIQTDFPLIVGVLEGLETGYIHF